MWKLALLAGAIYIGVSAYFKKARKRKRVTAPANQARPENNITLEEKHEEDH